MVMRKAVKASFDGRESKGKSTRGNGAIAVTKGSRLRKEKNKQIKKKKQFEGFKERPSTELHLSSIKSIASSVAYRDFVCSAGHKLETLFFFSHQSNQYHLL